MLKIQGLRKGASADSFIIFARRCADCNTLSDLTYILRAEVESGVPAPVLEWYTFSDMSYGPHRLGYRKCNARGCLKTETLQGSAFPQCSSCKLAAFCGKDCQITDWKTRHNVFCKKAKARRTRRNASVRFSKDLRANMNDIEGERKWRRSFFRHSTFSKRCENFAGCEGRRR